MDTESSLRRKHKQQKYRIRKELEERGYDLKKSYLFLYMEKSNKMLVSLYPSFIFGN